MQTPDHPTPSAHSGATLVGPRSLVLSPQAALQLLRLRFSVEALLPAGISYTIDAAANATANGTHAAVMAR